MLVVSEFGVRYCPGAARESVGYIHMSLLGPVESSSSIGRNRSASQSFLVESKVGWAGQSRHKTKFLDM